MSINTAGETSSEWFEDNDEEILNRLVSSNDIGSKPSDLDSFADRFQQDWMPTQHINTYWQGLMQSAQDMGFDVPLDDQLQLHQQQQQQHQGVGSFPAAFQTAKGQAHVAALSNLRRISKERAVKVTLSALSRMTTSSSSDSTNTSTSSTSSTQSDASNNTTSNLSVLLGSRALLEMCITYYDAQKIARLVVVTESLKMEQDQQQQQDTQTSPITNMLDKLDHNPSSANASPQQQGQEQKFLFRYLLTVACGPEEPPTREELQPSLNIMLSETTTTSSNGASKDPVHAHPPNQQQSDFIHSTFSASHMQRNVQRLQALQALLVLMYDRMANSVMRLDFLLVLLAFKERDYFMASLEQHHHNTAAPLLTLNSLVNDVESQTKMSALAGLICAECMSLWKCHTNDISSVEGNDWWMEHPLLYGAIATENNNPQQQIQAEGELTILQKLCLELGAHAMYRRKQVLCAIVDTNGVGRSPSSTAPEVPAPEALALLSFGLLQSLAYQSILAHPKYGSDSEGYWREFASCGLECTQLASEECGAFGYLHSCMEAFVSGYTHTTQSIDTSSVAYASIGREILMSTISAFSDTILSIHHPAACENIGMLCSLAHVVYQNQPVLCERFWLDWESYTTSTNDAASEGQLKKYNPGSATFDPLCFLMDAAYALAANALNAASGIVSSIDALTHSRNSSVEEALVAALAPLLRLISSVCSDPDMVLLVLNMLPNGMLRTALICCSSSDSKGEDDSVYVKNANFVLDSVATLIRLGRTQECRYMIQQTLEVANSGSGESGNDAMDMTPNKSEYRPDGPRVLYRIITTCNESQVATGALSILADLLQIGPSTPSESSTAATSPMWPLEASRFFVTGERGESGFARYVQTGHQPVTLAALRVLEGFVAHLPTVTFCKNANVQDATLYIQTTLEGTLVACRVLTSMLSMTNSDVEQSSYFTSTAEVILKLLGTFLTEIRPILILQESPVLRSIALDARNTVINLLATSTALGETIAYFLLSPVSLSLAVELDIYVEEAHLLSLASDETSHSEETKKYGAWCSLVRTQANNGARTASAAGNSRDGQTDVSSLVMAHMDHMISNISSLKFDCESLRARGWLGGGDDLVPMQAAHAAMKVILAWALLAEEMVENDPNVGGNLETLGPTRLLTSLAVMPPAVRNKEALASFWPSSRLSNLTLMLRYLPVGSSRCDATNSSKLVEAVTPTSLAIQVITACLTHTSHEAAVPPLSAVLGSTEQLQKIVYQALITASSTLESESDDNQVSQAIALLKMLYTAVVAHGKVASSILDTNNAANLVYLLTKTVSDLITYMERNEEVCMQQLSSRLRLGSGCLDILWALWKSSPAPDGNHVRKTIEANEEGTAPVFLNALFNIVIRNPSLLDVSGSQNAPSIRSVSMNILSKSLDIVSLEMMSANGDSKEEIWRLVKESTTKKSAMLASISKYYTNFDGALMLSKAWAEFSTSVQLSDALLPSDVLFTFSATSFGSRELMVDDFCNAKEAFEFFSKLSTEPVELGLEKISNLNSSFVLLSRELSLISSWKKFVQVYSLTTKRSIASISAHSEAQAFDGLQLAQETLRSLYDNVKIADVSHLTPSGHFLTADSVTMTYELAELLLHSLNQYVDLSDEVPTARRDSLGSMLTDMLCELQEASEKILSMICQFLATAKTEMLHSPFHQTAESNEMFKAFCVVQHRLLTSAIMIITLTESDPANTSTVPSRDQKRRDEYRVLFASIACKTLALLEPSASSPVGSEANSRNSSYCALLHTCVSLLTLLVSGDSASPGETGYFSKLAKSLLDSHAITSLVQQASAASKLAALGLSPTQNTYNHYLAGGKPSAGVVPFLQKDHDIAVEIVRAILLLASAIADAGDVSLDMLSLLADSGFSQLIVSNPFLQLASQQWALSGQQNVVSNGNIGVQTPRTLRGYVPADTTSIAGKQKGKSRKASGGRFFAGKDDPIHEVWRTAVHILAAALRSSSRSTEEKQNGRLNQHFILMALDFLGTHEATLLTCLNDCSAVSFREKNGMVSSAAKTSSTSVPSVLFTMNVLREACDISSLVSELCTGTNRNQFERGAPKLYKRFVQASLEMTCSISNFLGAAGAARELFQAISDFNSITAEEDPNNIHPLLLEGIPNARHEAIRNAHFANSCCAVVTSDDYDASINNIPLTSSSAISAESLEQSYQLIVRSPFILSMEHEAGECLYEALSILWKTHPSSSCFVVFTPEEAARLDSMTIVKPEMIIALRPLVATDSRGFCSLVNSREDPDRTLSFARVIGSDTVNREWHVQHLDASASREIVSADCLAGVEDVMKRKCIFEYDSAHFVHESEGITGRKVTLGHLILALRWCHQYSSTEGSNSDDPAVMKCLAERAAVLLGTEVALHEEIGTQTQVSSDVSKRVNAQLLDLFHDTTHSTFELSGNIVNGENTRQGQLKSVIEATTWDAIQKQICRELKSARNEKEEEQRKNSLHNDTGRRSGSPYKRGGLFRGVNF